MEVQIALFGARASSVIICFHPVMFAKRVHDSCVGGSSTWHLPDVTNIHNI